jgi:uracil DNA glycosylase
MKWESFKDQFHESWHEWVKPIIENPKFDEAFALLRRLAKEKPVIPSSESGNLFRIFKEVPFNKVNVVVVGLSPYNSYLNGKEIADGIAISCSKTGKEQPTLTQWYNAMEREYGDIIREPDLSYLCEQGVFLYNFSLTCGYMDALSHIPVWEWFSKELFRTAISALNVPVITLGKEAAKVIPDTMPWQVVYELKHPASASYSKTDWSDEGAFKGVKEIMDKQNIPFSWVKHKNKF